MEIVINRDEESYVITTPVDIVDDDEKEFSCIVETQDHKRGRYAHY